MNEYLAGLYGTNGTQQSAQADFEKQAQMELFAKMAEAEGINLEELNADQVSHLWESTFGTKLAEDGSEEDDEDEDDEEKEAAAFEFAQVKEAQVAVAQADYMGRVMAHAMTDELDKIAVSGAEIGARARDLAGRAKKGVRGFLGDVRDIATAKEFREGRTAMRNVRSSTGQRMRDASIRERMGLNANIGNTPAERLQALRFGRKLSPPAMLPDDAAFKAQENRVRRAAGKLQAMQEGAARGKQLRGLAKTVGLYGGAAGAVGLGAAALSGGKDKKSSAYYLDKWAAELAFEKAAEAGWDADEAAAILNSLLTLGPTESEKVAAADDLGEALEYRSLELLEEAGYPVNWD